MCMRVCVRVCLCVCVLPCVCVCASHLLFFVAVLVDVFDSKRMLQRCHYLCRSVFIAVGVYETESGNFRLISDGDLPSAVAASCAIPYIFQPVQGESVTCAFLNKFTLILSRYLFLFLYLFLFSLALSFILSLSLSFSVL